MSTSPSMQPGDSPMQPGDYNPSLLGQVGTSWLMSEKYDGWRALRMKDGTFMSRNGKPLAPPQHILDALAAMKLPPAAVLDGELWMGRGNLQHVTGAIASSNPKLQYVLFDMPSAPGGYHDRLQHLRTFAANSKSAAVSVIETMEVQGGPGAVAAVDGYFEQVTSQPHAEGIVIAPRDQPYHWGLRPSSFMKRKQADDMEVKVVGHHVTATAKKNEKDGYVSSLECCLLHSPTTLFKVSFKMADAPPVGSFVTIVYRGLTAAGVPRHANYKSVREDADMPPENGAAAAPAAEGGSLYDVLGVAPSCSLRDLKAGYKAACLKHHPDKGGDPALFKAVQDAYKVLGDKESREQYDRTGAGLAADQPMVGTRVPAKRGGKRKAADTTADAGAGPADKTGKAAKAAAPAPPPAPSSTELAPALGTYSMEQLASLGGVQLEACQFVKVQGSGSSVYEVKRPADGGALYCSCPAWRNQKTAAGLRTCKHCNAVAGLGLPAGKAPKKLRK